MQEVQRRVAHVFDVLDADAAVAVVLRHPREARVILRDVEQVHLRRAETPHVGAHVCATVFESIDLQHAPCT